MLLITYWPKDGHQYCQKGRYIQKWICVKNQPNLHFYRMCYGISYFQNYNYIPNPFPLYFMTSFQTVKYWNCVLPQTPNHLVCILFWINITTSIFRQPPEETSSIFFWNTATQNKCYSNLDKTPFFTILRTWNIELLNITIIILYSIQSVIQGL